MAVGWDGRAAFAELGLSIAVSFCPSLVAETVRSTRSYGSPYNRIRGDLELSQLRSGAGDPLFSLARVKRIRSRSRESQFSSPGSARCQASTQAARHHCRGYGPRCAGFTFRDRRVFNNGPGAAGVSHESRRPGRARAAAGHDAAAQ
eukprot:571532-Hanusia_phi.AAC.1